MRGSIDQRGPNTYRIRVELGQDPSGKRVQRTVTVHGTKREAQKKLAELLVEVNKGNVINTGTMSVAEYLDYWLANYARRLATRTFNNYAEYVEYYIKPGIGTIRLDQLQPAHIQALYTRLEECGGKRRVKALSPTTVFNLHRVLKGALRRAVQWQMLGRNPAEAVTPPRPVTRRPNVLTVKEVARVLEGARGNQLYIPVLIAVCTGLRRGEICGLRWQDVNLVDGVVAIQQTLVAVGRGKLEYKTTKTETGRRVVRMPALLVDALREEYRLLAERRSEVGSSYNRENLVVYRPNGTPMHPNTLYSNFQKLLRRIGIASRAIHDLRHSHATHLLEAKVHPKVVSERLGHSDPALTLRVYSHVLADIQQEAADQTNELLGRALKKPDDSSP